MTDAQIVFAETAIMLLHADEKRRATAKERVYAIIYPRKPLAKDEERHA